MEKGARMAALNVAFFLVILLGLAYIQASMILWIPVTLVGLLFITLMDNCLSSPEYFLGAFYSRGVICHSKKMFVESHDVAFDTTVTKAHAAYQRFRTDRH